MDNQEFCQQLCQRTGMTPQECTNMQEALAELITEQALQGNTVSLQGFGQFALKEKLPREIYNPATGEFHLVPGSYSLGFRPSKALKSPTAP